ncbi:MAG TPA: alpha-glucan family phosphorylase [Bryobacteraceae bacterium]|nr:alpha-glucan family phosphorylase [Bryobacteraceae bacterium]
MPRLLPWELLCIMSFQIRPQQEFLVQPALPVALSRLSELAYNLLWVWDRDIRSMFRRLDAAEWRSSFHNPARMLGQVSQATLEKAAADPRFVAMYNKACERLDAYMAATPTNSEKLIAYFSMEYGLAECLPIYSGGLGVLSGDHLKGASDLALPLVGVGLLYQKGYLRQSLNPDGWQIEKSPENDFYTLPLRPVMKEDGTELTVDVPMPGGDIVAKVWKIQVGRVRLFLLDTNIPQNKNPEMRDITDQLYGGDSHTRVRQEIVLGIGGLRALRALKIEPTVFHMNEGHSAFLGVERIRVLMSTHGLSFDEAVETCRANNVFTTHTPVPAGIDIFDPGLMHYYFREYCDHSGFSFDQFISLGRRNPGDQGESFSMAILAIKTSCWRNAVSALHGVVSREMWQDLWPNVPSWEVPITHVTNGVHLHSWVNGDLVQLYDNYLQPDWRDKATDPDTWKLIDDIPDSEIWEAHKRRKRQLISFVRGRLLKGAQQRKSSAAEVRRLSEALDPDVLTIGFARRFATYKRATLMLRDLPRLKRLLTNNRMPVQILIAGKAHPKDIPGKTLIREIFQLSRDPEIANRLIFVEDYSIAVARELVHGVDIWLNNPRRGEEACGTSGMKAGINGVLNLSILDGWFDESDEVSGGWSIGDRESYSDDQDEIHSSSILSLLESEIVPLYYAARADEVPADWVRRMKQSIKALTPQYDARRMLDDYARLLYNPAHSYRTETRSDNFTRSRKHVAWDQTVHAAWPNVRFVEMGGAPHGPVLSGHPMPMHAVVDLAGLQPDDVRVEAVVGRVSSDGALEDTEIVALHPVEQRGSAWLFGCDYAPHQTGRLGCAFRVVSNHFDNPLTRPCDALLKWS